MVKVRKIFAIGCLASALIFAALIGMAWLTGNIRPMTEAEKQAVEDRIKSYQLPPVSPTPKIWPSELPRTGPELPDAWQYAVTRILNDSRNWFLEDAKYRVDDPAAAHRALEEEVKSYFLDEMPHWKDAVDVIVERASRGYRWAMRAPAQCEKIAPLLVERFLAPTVLTKRNGDYQAVFVDYGILPGPVSYLEGKYPGWRVDGGTHQDPIPTHWNAWKSQEVAAELIRWRAAYPEAQLFVLRFTELRFGQPRHGYYTWRSQRGWPFTLSYWRPDDLGESGDIFDPKSTETVPHYLTARFQPKTTELSESDLATAAAGKLDLNELLLDFNPLKPWPARPPLTEEQRAAIVREVLEQGAAAVRQMQKGQ